MKIFNVRAGFATNSSSSHSIVMIPQGVNLPTREYERFKYGWEQFTLADRQSKSSYFAAQLFTTLSHDHNMDRETVVNLINSWCNTEYEPADFDDSYVDHQSVWGFLHKGDAVNPELVKAMHEFVIRPDVVILGGNDNSEGQTPPEGSWQNELTEAIGDRGFVRARQDGNYWAMFNDYNGNKIRFSVDANAPDYVKSALPELVDVKITDNCPYQCAFCFQASTPQGVHANLDSLVPIVQTLAKMGVFEIAYGGGEPTHYPHFAELLEITAGCGITPNFTTFGVDWLKNQRLVEVVKKYVKAIGVSVHNAKHVSKVTRIKDELDWDTRVVAQHVIGSVDMAETAELLEATWEKGIDILLLGYKPVGFGANVQPHDMTGLDTLLRLRQSKPKRWGTTFSMLGVDTAFVQQFDPILNELGIPKVLKTSEEGKFSMYIDAVTGEQGPSSYMPEMMKPLDHQNLDSSIRSAYGKW